MTDLSDWLALVGASAVGAALALLGLLSRKLGRVTHAKPYYLGFFAAAFLVAVAVIARLFDLGSLESVALAWLVYDGFPAAGVTLGVVFAWHYWSWLLAERD